MSTLGSRIKEYRTKRGFTQSQMANKLGMTEANFSSYERDKSAPPSDKLSQLSTILNVSADYLLFGENYEFRFTNAEPNDPNRESKGAPETKDDEWTKDELQEIEQFKEFIRMKKRQNNGDERST